MKQISKSLSDHQTINAETGLTSQQEKGAILLASGTKIEDVCQSLQIGRSTLYRWRRGDAFKCFLNLVTKDIKTYVETSVLDLHTDALRAVKDSLSSDNESVKLKAAIWILDKVTSIEVGETDIRAILMNQSQVSSGRDEWDREQKLNQYRNKLADIGLSE